MFLRYEEMKADLPAVIKKVAAFLGKQCTEDELKKLAEHLSFENMKNNAAVNYEPVCEANKKNGLTDSDGKFMRSGTVGSFKAAMTPEQINQIDKWSEENLKGTGFIF